MKKMVNVSESVKTAYNDFKMNRKYKFILFKLSNDLSEI